MLFACIRTTIGVRRWKDLLSEAKLCKWESYFALARPTGLLRPSRPHFWSATFGQFWSVWKPSHFVHYPWRYLPTRFSGVSFRVYDLCSCLRLVYWVAMWGVCFHYGDGVWFGILGVGVLQLGRQIKFGFQTELLSSWRCPALFATVAPNLVLRLNSETICGVSYCPCKVRRWPFSWACLSLLFCTTGLLYLVLVFS